MRLKSNPSVVATYTYDALGRGRRIGKVVGSDTTRYVHAGAQAIEEYDGTTSGANLRRLYVFGERIDQVVAMEAPDAADVDGDSNTSEVLRFSFHTQLVGSVTQVTAPSGSVAESYEYDPYGKPTIKDAGGSTISASAIGNSYLFTARQLDAETGLYYYRARHYSPELRRFVQRDPLEYVDGPNALGYCGSSPTRSTDPAGCSSWGGLSLPGGCNAGDPFGVGAGTGPRVVPPRPGMPPFSTPDGREAERGTRPGETHLGPATDRWTIGGFDILITVINTETNLEFAIRVCSSPGDQIVFLQQKRWEVNWSGGSGGSARTADSIVDAIGRKYPEDARVETSTEDFEGGTAGSHDVTGPGATANYASFSTSLMEDHGVTPMPPANVPYTATLHLDSYTHLYVEGEYHLVLHTHESATYSVTPDGNPDVRLESSSGPGPVSLL